MCLIIQRFASSGHSLVASGAQYPVARNCEKLSPVLAECKSYAAGSVLLLKVNSTCRSGTCFETLCGEEFVPYLSIQSEAMFRTCLLSTSSMVNRPPLFHCQSMASAESSQAHCNTPANCGWQLPLRPIMELKSSLAELGSCFNTTCEDWNAKCRSKESMVV